MTGPRSRDAAARARFAGLAELVPDWDAPPRVRAFVTGRRGGTSRGPWGLADGGAGGLNLATHCGDDPANVAANRARLGSCLPSPPVWLQQVHGTQVHVAQRPPIRAVRPPGEAAATSPPQADAAVTSQPGVVLAVLSADCLPVLLADAEGRAVGVAHAGWRGLACGVVENTVDALRARIGERAELIAWLGPAIGARAFEVGEDVLRAFCERDAACEAAFFAAGRAGKWHADLFLLARLALGRRGVRRVDGGGCCTFEERERFYSFRRDRDCGRMASLIWLDA